MIGYLIDRFSGLTGMNRSGIDVLRALVAYGKPLVLATADKRVADPGVVGLPNGAWRPMQLPRLDPYAPGPRRVDHWLRFLTPNFVGGWLRARWPDDVRVVLVNGLANHGRWRLIRGDGRKSAIICRASPRHFQGRLVGGLDWALQAMRQYDAVIFVSSNCRDEWVSLGGTSMDTSFYVPNCCEEDEAERYRNQPRAEVRNEVDLPADRFVIGCVASLQHRKGQDLLVEQLPALIERHPELLVVFCGPDSEFGNKMRQRVAELGIASSVQFRPPVPDALPLIRAADVAVLPARAEAMPRVILEAMAAGTPMVASDVDGNRELIEHDATGWLFPIDRPRQMADGLERAITDSESARRWSEAARRRYWENYSRSRLEARYAAVLDQLLGECATQDR